MRVSVFPDSAHVPVCVANVSELSTNVPSWLNCKVSVPPVAMADCHIPMICDDGDREDAQPNRTMMAAMARIDIFLVFPSSSSTYYTAYKSRLFKNVDAF